MNIQNQQDAIAACDALGSYLRGQAGQPQPNPNPGPGPGPTPNPTPEPQPQPTPSGVKVIDLPWNSGGERTYTAHHGGFGANDIIAFRFTTPAQVSGGAANISESLFPGHGGSAASRQAVISRNPGDFTPVAPGCESRGNEGTTITFTVGRQIPYTPELQPNTTYYYNVRYVDGADGGNIQALRGGAAS